MGRFSRISHVAVTGSTNDDVAAILGDDEARGLVRVADYQERGSGRRGRSWIAPSGSALLCTLALPDALPATNLWAVPYWAALVVRAALRDADVNATLQWPNDVLSSAGAKIAGILCISRVTGEFAWAACGIGINVVRPQQQSHVDAIVPAPAFVNDFGEVTIDGILQRIVHQADELYDLLEQPPRVAFEWQQGANVPGVRYRIQKDGEDSPFEATALRLLNDGSLLVDRDGEEAIVTLAEARVLR